MNILIDALTMSFKWDAVLELTEALGIEPILEKMQPRRNKYYNNGMYYPGLQIGYDVDEFGNIQKCLIDLSGTGCRLIESLNENFDWFGFFWRFDKQLKSKDAHISRIDLACDVYDDTVDYDKILRATQSRNYLCLSEKRRWIDGDEKCIYFGSEKSDRMLRIYDKALEQGIAGKWLRFEFQLRNESAMSLYLTHDTCPDLSIGEIYAGIIKNYIRFVSVPKGQTMEDVRNQGHQGRLNNTKWWDNFVGDAEKLPQLYLPGEEYTLDRLENYIKTQLYSSLKTYVLAGGRPEEHLTNIIKGMLDKDINKKQEILLDQLRINKLKEYQKICSVLHKIIESKATV